MGLIRVTDPCTDMANAHYFVEHFGEYVRYVTTWKKMLAWTGRAWRMDEAAVMRFAMRAAEMRLGAALEMYTDAVKALASVEAAEGDTTEAKKAVARAHAYVSWARKSQHAPRILAMLSLAKNAEAIAIEHTDLDADPYALNVANGTLDMSTGRLRPYDPRDLITKLAPVEYDPEATAPTWEAFVTWAMQGDDALVGYLRRVTGYGAIGVIREHVLGFMFGGGKNGKSTFLGRIQHVLGDYAQVAPRGLLFTTRTPQHPTELATLYGARFVTCSEIEEGRAFDEAKVKDLTGGDLISARRMGEDFWKFAPSHTLFLAGNHKPNVRGTDDGIWRRIRVIPWLASVTPETMDPGLPAKLDAEAAGILAWIVRGALEWQRVGLGDPPEVTAATQTYRDESDPLAEFFALRCVFESDGKVPRKMLRTAYDEYCAENGIRNGVDARAFAARLREHGVTDGDVWSAGKTVNGWRGVRLRDLDRESSVDLGNDRVVVLRKGAA